VGDIVVFVLVGLAAVGAAGAVYGLTSQRGTASSPGAESLPPDPDPAPGHGAAYLPVVASGSSWHTRVIGIVGIVLMVSVGAVLLAISVYVGGSMLVRFLTHATHTG
jgi:hypothetical protein